MSSQETGEKWRALPPRVRLADTVAEQAEVHAVNPLPEQKAAEIGTLQNPA